MIGNKVRLRALEPEDLPLLYAWENDPENWTISNTTAPFSKHILQQFIETSSQDIYVNRQLRLMVVENTTARAVGCVDVFDFDPGHRRAGLGILIDESARCQGYGLESILLAKEYLFKIVGLHQIFCNIMANNRHSISIFQKAGFEICGKKREWIRTPDGWVDELTLQTFNKH